MSGGVKQQRQEGEGGTQVCPREQRTFEEGSSCHRCGGGGSSYEEETNNNNQAVLDTDSETTPEGSSVSWEEPWPSVRKESVFSIPSPGTPSYIAKDANSLTFQWEAVAIMCCKEPSVEYDVEMQELDIIPGSLTPNSAMAKTLVDEEEWHVVYSGKECWTQVKELLPGGYYAVRIRCRTETEQKSDYSTVVVMHTTPTIPSQPQPPELAEVAHSTMTLKWSPPWEHGGSEITGYRMQLRPPPGPAVSSPEFEDVYMGPELFVQVVNLLPFVKYTARVKAMNEVGEGPWSLLSCFKTKPHLPNIPQDLHGRIVSPCCVQLEWSSDTSTGRHRDLYEIEVENAEQEFYASDCSGHMPYHDVDGLECGHEYRFRVRAKNEIGPSDWSSPVNLCLPPIHPSPPLRPIITFSTEDGVGCAWYQPQVLGGKSLIQYQVEVISVSPTLLEGSSQTWKIVYQGPRCECILRELMPGCEYCMRVKATNEAGDSPPSTPVQFLTAPGVPLTPRIPHAVERNSRMLRIYWIGPTHDGGREVTQYKMQVCPATQLTVIEDTEPFVDVYEGSRNSVDLVDLHPGALYAFRVCAINEVGSSEWSDIGYESTPPGPPLPPQNLRVSEQDARSLRINWDSPEADGGAPITTYVVALVKDSRSSLATENSDRDCEEDRTHLSDASPEFQIVYTDLFPECFVACLEPSTSYLIKAKAINEHGDSDWSQMVSVKTRLNLPLAPTKLEVLETTCTSIRLGWTFPCTSHTGDETTFTAEIATDSETWEERYRGKEAECCLCGLVAGEDYQIRVRGVNQDGSGPFSSLLSVSTASTVPSKPEAPCVTQIASSVIRIKWTAPEGNGKRILQYFVEVHGEDGALFEAEAPSSDSFLRLADLSSQTEYRLRLRAVNEMGSSEWSNAVIATTTAQPPCPPRDLTAVVQSSQTPNIEISWKMSEKTEELTYDVEAYLSGNKRAKSLPAPTVRATATSMFCVLSGLERGQKYDIRIRATRPTGISGKWSDFVSVRVLEEGHQRQISAKPSVQEPHRPAEEKETSIARRPRKGQVIVPTKTKNPLRRRKPVWKIFGLHSLVLLAVFVALVFFIMLFFQEQGLF